MGIFATLKEKIFGSDEAKELQAKAAPAPAPAAAPAAAPVAPAPVAVNLDETLAYMAQKRGQPSNYKTSIVDLMKLVGMESSLSERKELADELGYTGDKSDSAAMNIWLHKQVLKRLRDNGGKVPADLAD